jgi:hypothetical protein
LTIESTGGARIIDFIRVFTRIDLRRELSRAPAGTRSRGRPWRFSRPRPRPRPRSRARAWRLRDCARGQPCRLRDCARARVRAPSSVRSRAALPPS